MQKIFALLRCKDLILLQGGAPCYEKSFSHHDFFFCSSCFITLGCSAQVSGSDSEAFIAGTLTTSGQPARVRKPLCLLKCAIVRVLGKRLTKVFGDCNFCKAINTSKAPVAPDMLIGALLSLPSQILLTKLRSKPLNQLSR